MIFRFFFIQQVLSRPTKNFIQRCTYWQSLHIVVIATFFRVLQYVDHSCTVLHLSDSPYRVCNEPSPFHNEVLRMFFHLDAKPIYVKTHCILKQTIRVSDHCTTLAGYSLYMCIVVFSSPHTQCPVVHVCACVHVFAYVSAYSSRTGDQSSSVYVRKHKFNICQCLLGNGQQQQRPYSELHH